MRFIVYIKNGNNEQMLYDSESGDLESIIGSPKLKLELNKAGSFGFTIYPSHSLYNSFQRLKTYVRITLDDDEIFRGRVLQIEDGTWLERKIQCEGDLAYLIDSIQYPDQTETTTTNGDLTVSNASARNRVVESQKQHMPSESINIARVNLTAKNANHESIQNHFIRYLTVHRAQVDSARDFGLGNITIEDKNVEQDFTRTNYCDTQSAIDNDLLNYYGGFLQTRKSNGVVYLDWLEDPGGNASQEIKMGVNLIDLQQQANDMDVFTRLIPVGDNQLTIESVNDNKNYIQKDSGYNKYGAIYKTESFSDVTTASELLRKARSWLKKNYKDDPLTLNIKAVDMHMYDGSIEMIKLGTKVHVVSEPHDISMRMYVTGIEYDIQNPENNTYEIGDPYETLSTKTKKKKQSTDRSLSSAENSASSASRGVSGLQNAVNRHAQNISDIADGLYNIKADTLNVTARVINVEAEEININSRLITVEADLLDIHTKAVKINSETVEITADYAIIGNIIMGDPPGQHGEGDYEMRLIGDTLLMGTLDVGSGITAPRIDVSVESEDGGIFIDDEKLNILDIEVDENDSNILHIYKADGTEITFSKATTLSGTWSGSTPPKTLIITASPQNQSYQVQFGGTYASGRTNLEIVSNGYLSVTTSSNVKMLSVPVKVQSLTGAQSQPEVVYETSITASTVGILESARVTSNGYHYPSSNKIGFGSIYVDVPLKVVYDPSYYVADLQETYKVVKPTTSTSGFDFLRIWPRNNGLSNGTRTIDVICGSTQVERLTITDYTDGQNSMGVEIRDDNGTKQIHVAESSTKGYAITRTLGSVGSGGSRTITVKAGSTTLYTDTISDYSDGQDSIGVEIRDNDGTKQIHVAESSTKGYAITRSLGSVSNGSRTITVNAGSTTLYTDTITDYSDGFDAGNANRASQITGFMTTSDTATGHLSAGQTYKFQSQYKKYDGTWANGGTVVVDTPANSPGTVTVTFQTAVGEHAIRAGRTSDPIEVYSKLNGTTKVTTNLRMTNTTYVNGDGDTDYCVDLHVGTGTSGTRIGRISTQSRYTAGRNSVKLQTKDVTITSGTTLNPDSGYDGFSKVTIRQGRNSSITLSRGTKIADNVYTYSATLGNNITGNASSFVVYY